VAGAIEKSPNPTVNKRGVVAQSERYYTEGCNNVITEAEVIYESLSSHRQTPDKVTASSSAKCSDNTTKGRKSRSPKPSRGQQNGLGAKSIYANYKNANQKQLSTKSPRKVQDKSLNASLEKPLKDNYVGNSFQKKHFISPRATTSQDKGNIYNSLSNRKAMLSTSLGFAPGALKEKTNNSNVVDRLSSNNAPSMKVHKGPFHLNSVTTKNPKYMMSELTKVLENNKIYFRNVTKYCLKCEKDTNKFEIELNSLQNHDNVYIVKFSKQSGDITKSNEICSLIYRSLDM